MIPTDDDFKNSEAYRLITELTPEERDKFTAILDALQGMEFKQ